MRYALIYNQNCYCDGGFNVGPVFFLFQVLPANASALMETEKQCLLLSRWFTIG